MPPSRLHVVASQFRSKSEDLHNTFQAIRSDTACAECQNAGFAEAILSARLQDAWTDFSRQLVIVSALGTRRAGGKSVGPVAGVKSLIDAERIVKDAATSVARKRGHPRPVWHDPLFAMEVGSLVGLNNLPRLRATFGPTVTPAQVTHFRNYLVHPGQRTLVKYEEIQAKLGMLRVDPQNLLHQYRRPGVLVFTSWVRELQRIAYDSTQ